MAVRYLYGDQHLDVNGFAFEFMDFSSITFDGITFTVSMIVRINNESYLTHIEAK